ncbi:hypothetical protein PU02_0252 [Bartonella ancashensis]|uniref:Uncharacterized protein n=1 Tax=Bartonella ancashensis TaxID=1318743 RepID=A0A0M5KSD7_9HYPH|nr:hypothetical protein PU02_0252 [Bartonella ancashensis]
MIGEAPCRGEHVIAFFGKKHRRLSSQRHITTFLSLEGLHYRFPADVDIMSNPVI